MPTMQTGYFGAACITVKGLIVDGNSEEPWIKAESLQLQARCIYLL